MDKNATPRQILFLLAVGALVLPIVVTVLVGVAGLLGQMNDAAGAQVVGRISLACGILWILDLVGLSILHSLTTLGHPPPRDDP